MITRTEYLNNQSTHHEYYSQFVSNNTINLVKYFLGDLIHKSTDKNFNDIPLEKWDNLSLIMEVPKNKMKECGEIVSLGTKVCTLKAAAKIIKDNHSLNC